MFFLPFKKSFATVLSLFQALKISDPPPPYCELDPWPLGANYSTQLRSGDYWMKEILYNPEHSRKCPRRTVWHGTDIFIIMHHIVFYKPSFEKKYEIRSAHEAVKNKSYTLDTKFCNSIV